MTFLSLVPGDLPDRTRSIHYKVNTPLSDRYIALLLARHRRLEKGTPEYMAVKSRLYALMYGANMVRAMKRYPLG